MPEIPPLNPEVKKVFDRYPKPQREGLLAIRELIFEVARSIDAVGELQETLKWGEPSYLTAASKTGTTIRIDWKQQNPNFYAMYFNCQTDLLDRFRKDCPGDFEFDGNRAIRFSTNSPIPVDPLSKCIAAALTYHRDKRNNRSE